MNCIIKLLLVIFIFSVNILQASINVKLEKIEPAFWWINMNNPKLQILVYGKDISLSTPKIKQKGITISKISTVKNPNYLFIDLEISKNCKACKFKIDFNINNKKIAQYIYELKNRVKGSAERQGFSSSDVLYLFMPDRFANGDPTNDNMPGMKEKANRKLQGGRHGGDIQGVINNLNYINELGVTAIWSTPMQEDNCETFSYHGYAISDYYKIDPRYGSNKLYCKMVEKCHSKNIKVVMDMISNHCGIEHWWMKDLPSEDWIHQHKEYTNSNHIKKAANDPHASAIDKLTNMNGWFDKTMPDLNQKNPFLLTYLIQNTIWWIEYANIDGIRMDTYPYNDYAAMANWAESVMTEYPNFNIVGECWQHEAHEVAFWQSNSINPTGYNSHLKTVMDFPLTECLSKALNENEGWATGMRRIYFSLGNDYLYPDINNLLIFAENHDTHRFNHEVKESIGNFKIAMAFLLTTRGTPQLYYGTEIAMTGDKNNGDGDIRHDFPGGWKDDKQNAFTEKGRTENQNKYFNYLKNILNWRKTKSVIHTGKLTHFVPYNDIYVYFRYNKDETVMVILNNNDISETLNTSRFSECLQTFTEGIDIINHKKITNLKNIKLAPKSAMILELN